jgi:uncharacterized protein YvpB
MTIKTLDVPYYSQLDNKYEPYTACNVTSLAMCLSYWEIESPEYMQLEDALLQMAVDNGLNRFTVAGIKTLAESFEGIIDHVTEQGTLQDIRDSIDQGWPMILHGYFTPPGHIIVIRGYTREGFIVNDPYGEIVGLSHYDTNKSGASLHYSNGLIAAACDSWCHAQAKQRYPMSSREAERCNSLWLHRIEGPSDHLLK